MISCLKKNLKFVFWLVCVGFVIGVFYSFVLFKPSYTSTSSLLINDKGLSNHIYILKSGNFAQKVWKKIRKKYESIPDNRLSVDRIKRAINIDNPVNTNIIKIDARWNDPIVARDITSAFVTIYKNLNPKVTILDAPAIPFYSNFPGRLEMLALFALFSGLVALVVVFIYGVLKNSYNNSEEIERDIGVPILGTIPWLDKEIYDEPDIMFAIDEAASFYSLAYQKAVSCLKLRGYSLKKRVFAFTSTEFSKFRSTIIMNIAYSLSRAGESVIVVDADFRTPSIGKEIELNMNNKGDLSELLNDFSGEKSEKEIFVREKIDYYTYSVPGIDNFYIIPNNGNASDPSLYLHSDSFKLLIQELRLKYDWVFVDIPPALAVPDALMLGHSVDGVVLITGLETDKLVLKSIYKQFKTYNIDVFGVITREIQTKEAASSNVYIKQMITQMMSQNQGLITE